MNIKLVSFNGTNINDSTNYDAFIPADIPLQGSARPIFVDRPERRPVFASKVLDSYTLPIKIAMKGTVSTQINTLKALFDVEDMTPRKLIVKNTADSDKQWHVYATTKSMPQLQKNVMTIILAIADPVWYEETESTDTWAITASGQTKNITVAGNVKAAPRFVATPTSVGGSGYGYKGFARWRNPSIKKAMLNYPLDIVDSDWDTAALIADASNYVLINNVAGIDDSVTTIPYDGEVGSFPTSGMAYIGTEQISYTGLSGGNITGVTRGINGTTAAAHANDVEIYYSYIQADGDDVRVMVNGSEVRRWLYGINTATTKVWVNLDFQPGIDLTLKTAIADSGAITAIFFNNNNVNKKAIKNLPEAGQLLIGDELFTYTAVDAKNLKVTGVTRSVKGTAAAAHAVDDPIYWIEHEIYIYFGNGTLEDPADDDPDYDKYKPIIALSSTNTSWVYTDFMDDARLRSGIWTPSINRTANRIDDDHKSGFYTADADTESEPAEDMGMSIKAFQSGTRWKAESAIISWDLYHPAGVTAVTASGEKYRFTSKWPYARLKKNISGSSNKWVTVWTDATPTALQTWEDLAAHSAVALSSTYYYLKFEFSGTVGATADSVNYYEIDAVTLALDSSNVPQGQFNAPQSNYHIQAVITNVTSGDWIKVTTGMELNTTLTIDCLNKLVYLVDNSPVANVTFSSVRKDWLPLAPGVNQLKFEDVGTAGVTLVTNWRDRNN